MNNNTSLQIYEELLSNIPSPSPQHRFRDYLGKPVELSIMFIEFREHAWTRPVLRNIANVYGSCESMSSELVIICGRTNWQFMKTIISEEGIKCTIIKLDVDNIDRYNYNHLLTSAKFWQVVRDNIHSTHVLLIQTDTLTRKVIPSKLLEYDYVGAPWKEPQPGGHLVRRVGNGGYSLRRVQAMIDVCENNHFDIERDRAEDLFFGKHCLLVPEAHEASEFAVEHVFHKDPCGVHQIWIHHPQTLGGLALPLTPRPT